MFVFTRVDVCRVHVELLSPVRIVILKVCGFQAEFHLSGKFERIEYCFDNSPARKLTIFWAKFLMVNACRMTFV